MDYKNIIIYGAGNLGKKVYAYMEGFYNVLFFIDGDINKQGTTFCGKKVYAPEILKEYPDADVVIASGYYDEMYEKLKSMNVKKIFKSEFQTRWVGGTILDELNTLRKINLGKFLHEFNNIDLKYITYIYGGSGVLDYAFLRALISKFGLKNYLEIGTYIGESISNVADLCEVCHSVTLPPEHEYSMKNICKYFNIPDFSERLTKQKNIVHHYCDSKKFDFNEIKEDIDIFFIDGDHSYESVIADTENIFKFRNPDSFVVWHDFLQYNYFNDDVIMAVKEVLKDDFKNVYITDNNACGIYIPEKYQKYFELNSLGYTEYEQDLYYYNTSIKPNVDRAKG